MTEKQARDGGTNCSDRQVMARRRLYRQCLYDGQAWMRRACLFGDTGRIIGVDMRDWKEDRMNTASENTEKMPLDGTFVLGCVSSL